MKIAGRAPGKQPSKLAHNVAAVLLLFATIVINGFSQAKPGVISTYAGSAGEDGPAIYRTIGMPYAVISDRAGGFYFSRGQDNKVYRVLADGTLKRTAGTGTSGFSGDGGPATSAKLAFPIGLTLDAAGNLLIADYDNGRIRKVTPAGVISTIAGTGVYAFSGDGGPATSAGMGAMSVAVDASGNILISDTDNLRIRKISLSGIITTVVGTGDYGFGGDGGPATSARLALPVFIAVDGAGNLLIADYDNGRIRKVTPAGIISTVAGNGDYDISGDGGPATVAGLGATGVAADSAGNIFLADVDNHRIRKVDTAGIISTVAGTVSGFGGDGGPAIAARLDGPFSVAVEGAGNLLIADSVNERIRKVAAGIITTVAGTTNEDGDGGLATFATLDHPQGVAMDATGNLFIADSDNYRIRRVSPDGIITSVVANELLAVPGGGVVTVLASLYNPAGVAVDGAGNLYIADTGSNRIRRVNPVGIISTIAGTVSAGFNGDGGPAASAGLNRPTSVVVDAAGNIFIADSQNNRIRKVNPAGIISTVAGGGAAGFETGPATSAQLFSPFAIALDAAGNLLIADTFNNRIRKVTPQGIISTIAGNGPVGPASGFSGDGGPATSAQLSQPNGIAVDKAGNIFVTDAGNVRIRKIAPDGIISTVAGNGTYGFTGDGGPATSAQFTFAICCAAGLAVDEAGNVFIADYGNNRIRKVTFVPAIQATEIKFSMPDRGVVSLRTAGNLPSTVVGYSRIEPNIGSATPAGLAIFGYRQGVVLVSEAGVPASPAIRSGRIYAEIDGPVNTGLAIANPNSEPAAIGFYFTDARGNFGSGTATVPANGQIARFLNEDPFKGPSPFIGSFTFSSSLPVAVIALRGLTNERSEFLITTLPVIDLLAPISTDTMVFPHFAAGGDWTTQIDLVNPGNKILTGRVEFVGSSGSAVSVVINNQINTAFNYSIPAESSQKLTVSGSGSGSSNTLVGSIHVVPASGTQSPSGIAVFSFRKNGVTISEAGVPTSAAGAAFRLYVENSRSTQTGLAVANTSFISATITLELSNQDGSSTGLRGTLSIPANGQSAIFLNQIPGFEELPSPFQGVLRLSGTPSFVVLGLRGRYNERDDFLMTTIPPVNEAAPTLGILFFPHIADSGGFTTQFILFSAQSGASSAGTLQFFTQTGNPWQITLQ